MNVFNLIPLRYAPTALTVVGGLKEAIFTVPVLMLFYGFKGVDIGDFFLIQGLSWLCVFFCVWGLTCYGFFCMFVYSFRVKQV